MKIILTSLTLATLLCVYSAPVFCATPIPPSSSSQSLLININTATLEELKSVPHIGPKRAKAIIEYRQQHGNFTAVEDLQEVKNISPKTSAKLAQYFKIEAADKPLQPYKKK